MVFIRKAVKILILILVWPGILFFCPEAPAGQFTLLSTLNLEGDYNDNINYDRIDPKEDYVFSIVPTISLISDAERSYFQARAWFDILRYARESEEDLENSEYSIWGKYNLSRRTSSNFNLSFRKDTTQDGELDETGQITVRQGREQYLGNGEISWKMSELITSSVSYAYLMRKYTDFTGQDYEQHRISLSIGRSFHNGLDTISLRPSYYHQIGDTYKLDYYSASIGWTHIFDENFRLSGYVGGRDYNKENDNGSNGSSSGVIVDFNLTRTKELSKVVVGYRRDLYTQIGGGQTDVDHVYCQLYRGVFQRFGIALNGDIYFRRNDRGASNDEQTYFKVSPAISYNLTERHVLEMGYSYANSYSRALENNRTVDQSKVWIAVKLRFENIF